MMDTQSTQQETHLDIDKIVTYWQTEADEALQVAEHLMEKGDYSYALFFGHLVIEKMLKALYVKRQSQHAPLVHNLVYLAQLIELELDEEKTELLATITTFNIEARYPDLKRTFRQRCTQEFATTQMTTIKEIRTWLKSQ